VLSDAEVIKVASDVLDQLPAAKEAGFRVRIGHTRLIEAFLGLCHVDPGHHADFAHYLHELPKVRARVPAVPACAGLTGAASCVVRARPAQLGWDVVRKGLLDKAHVTVAAVDLLGPLLKESASEVGRGSSGPSLVRAAACGPRLVRAAARQGRGVRLTGFPAAREGAARRSRLC